MTYNININFLSDRKIDASATGTSMVTTYKPTTMEEKIPIFIGGGVGVALVAVSFGALLLMNSQKTSTENNIVVLDQKIQRLQGQNDKIKEIQGEIDGIKEEINALVSVFTTIKPSSAMLAEISSILPPSIRIDSIQKSADKSFNLSGTAKTYDAVNDFILTLKKSQFFNPETIKLQSTTIQKNPKNIRLSGNDETTVPSIQTKDGETKPAIDLPEVVSYKICGRYIT